MFSAIKINLMQCILSGQYILVGRFLRKSGYLVECEILSTLGCQFPSKRSLENSKITEVCLNLTLEWQLLDAFLPQKPTYIKYNASYVVSISIG